MKKGSESLYHLFAFIALYCVLNNNFLEIIFYMQYNKHIYAGERCIMKKCVLDESKECVQCGECDKCDLDPNKVCDNCGRCIGLDADSRAIKIEDVIIRN